MRKEQDFMMRDDYFIVTILAKYHNYIYIYSYQNYNDTSNY